MEISDSSYPHTMAKSYADMSALGAQQRLAAQKSAASTNSTALNTLRTALGRFNTALATLTAKPTGVVQYGGTLSDTTRGSVAVSGGATPGSYSFYVESLASSHQLSSGTLAATVPTAGAGSFSIQLQDGSSFDVDLATADGNGDGDLTPAEIARAINQASGGKVSAATLTVNGQQRLVLNSGVGGADGEITLDAAAVGDAGLRAALQGTTETSEARNAVFHLGGQGGTRIEQGSNTFTGIEGVQLTFTKSGGDVGLTVARDDSATSANVQSFVDAYNALKTTLDGLTRAGDLASGDAGGAFSSDAGVRALRTRLDDILRQAVGGKRLSDIGISADKKGQLSLDGTQLRKALELDPELPGTLLGDGKTGLTGVFNNYLDTWLSSTKGQLKSRQDSAESIQKALNKRELHLNDQYDRFYARYLAQFTQVQVMDAQMKDTLSLLEAMLPSTSK